MLKELRKLQGSELELQQYEKENVNSNEEPGGNKEYNIWN